MRKLIYIVDRLKEPNSYRTLLFLAATFQIPQIQLDNWLGVLSLAAGVMAILLPESGKVGG